MLPLDTRTSANIEFYFNINLLFTSNV